MYELVSKSYEAFIGGLFIKKCLLEIVDAVRPSTKMMSERISLLPNTVGARTDGASQSNQERLIEHYHD